MRPLDSKETVAFLNLACMGSGLVATIAAAQSLNDSPNWLLSPIFTISFLAWLIGCVEYKPNVPFAIAITSAVGLYRPEHMILGASALTLFVLARWLQIRLVKLIAKEPE